MDNTNVYIMDVYNREIYPHDGYAKSKYMTWHTVRIRCAFGDNQNVILYKIM